MAIGADPTAPKVGHHPSIGLEQPGCIAWEPGFAPTD
jgi:hypothetical protein